MHVHNTVLPEYQTQMFCFVWKTLDPRAPFILSMLLTVSM